MNSPDWPSALAPSMDDMAALADRVFADLPEPFKSLAGDVRMQVEEFADDETLEELGLEDPFELTGLYRGVSLAERSVLDPVPHLAQIFLYRRAILDEWIDNGEVTLGDLITNVLIHEIGHHFGLSDHDIHTAEEG